jgi:hypothetical protein
MMEISRIDAIRYDWLHVMQIDGTWRSLVLQNVEQSCQSSTGASGYA